MVEFSSGLKGMALNLDPWRLGILRELWLWVRCLLCESSRVQTPSSRTPGLQPQILNLGAYTETAFPHIFSLERQGDRQRGRSRLRR